MRKKSLRHGYTTGACAAAAARGAALMLREQRTVEEVELVLPGGEKARFRLFGQRFDETSAACFVVKDAGDDPDVTHGCEVWAEVTSPPCGHPPCETGGAGGGIIEGGAGIGRVTKPGLAVPPGEWAINPVPRRMIAGAVAEVLGPSPVRVTISIPDGAERAKRTLNARLGILGGLSILGTTGIVRPISAAAWTDTIDAALDVAVACGCKTVVLSTGRTSEMVAEKVLTPPSPPCFTGGVPEGRGGRGLPEEAFIMMGDHVGHALRACARRGVRGVVLAGQFAKLLKIACGHEQTHVGSSALDLRELEEWTRLGPRFSVLGSLIGSANTARELLEASGHDPELVALVCGRAKAFAESLVPGAEVQVLLAGYDGRVLYFA
jgi:cobalt-precorrin-5B (C1)-methyltransferase